MKNVKRFIAGLATFAISLSFVISNGGLVTAGTFSDVPTSSPFYSFVEQLASAGVVSGDRGTYNPFGNATRGELAKMVVNASGAAINSSAGPSFSDVPTSNVFYNYVETAKANGWISGYGDGSFRPNNQVTRAEAAKIIVNALDIPVQSPASPSFADVTRSNVFYTFIEGARAAGLASPNAFYRGNDLITRQEIAKFVASAMTYDPTSEPVEAPVSSGNVLTVNVSNTTPAAQTIPKNGNNVVFLSVDMTAGAVEDVEVRSMNISLLGLGDDDDFDAVKVFDGVKQLGSDKTFASEEDVARFNLAVEPIIVPAGTTKTIDIRADLAGGNIANNENYFAVISPEDVDAFGAVSGGSVNVTGAFPVVGNTMRLGSISVAQVNFTELSLSDKTSEIGENDQVVTKFKVKVDGGTGDEDVLLQALTLEQKGSAKTDEIVNISLWVGNEQVGETIPTLDIRDQVTFDLSGLPDGGLLLRDGESRIFRVKTDIINGIDSTVYFEVDESSDIIALGTTYGFGVEICEDSTDPICDDDFTGSNTLFDDGNLTDNFVTIEGGDLSFSFFSVADTVSNDIEDYAFGTLRITNGGEAVTIESLQLELFANGGSVTAGTLTGTTADITDVKLVGPNGTVTGPVDPSGTTKVAGSAGNTQLSTMTFPDDFDIPAGATVEYTLQGDIESSAPAGFAYYFVLDMDGNTLKTEGITSGDNDKADISPSSDIQTQPQTIEAAGLSITEISQSNDSIVSDTDAAELIRFSVRAGDSEAITVTDLAFDVLTPTGANQVDNLQKAALYVSYDGGNTEIKKESNVNPDTTATSNGSGSISFSDLDEDGFAGIALAAGEEAVIIVRADIAGDITGSSPTVQLSLQTSEITAEDSDFDTLETSAITAGSSSSVEGPILTIVDSGSLYVRSTSATADPSLYVAGADKVEFSAFTIEGKDENVDLDDITLTIEGGFVDGATTGQRTVDAVSLWYADGSPVKFDNGTNAELAGITTTSSTTANSGTVDFTDLNLIAKDGVEETIVIKADLRTVGDDANDTAVAGASVKIGIVDADTDVTAKGFSSGAQLTAAAINDDSYSFTTGIESMVIVGAYPVLTLHAQSPDTVATGSDVEVFRFTVTNPANASSSDIWLKAMILEAEITDGASGDLDVYNYKVRDAGNPSSSLTSCVRMDQATSGSGSAADNSQMVCNLETTSSASGYLDNDADGFEISNGTSETLFVTVDIQSFDLEKDSLLFKIPAFGSPTSSVDSSLLNTGDALFAGGSATAATAGLSSFGNTGSGAAEHAIIWHDEEGSALLHYLDTDSIDFRSNRLTGF